MIMKKEIFEDPIYKQFFAALDHMLKTDWKGKQTLLANLSGISKGYMTDIVKGDRKPTFEKRNKLAIECGFSYEKFLELGNKRLGGNAVLSLLEFQDKIEEEHFGIVRKFKNKEKAKEFNHYLQFIESQQEEAFDDLFKEARATYRAIKRISKKDKPASGE